MSRRSWTPIGVFTGGQIWLKVKSSFSIHKRALASFHISAVERAGMSNLNEGQELTYDVVSERGKLAASNLQNV